MGPSDSISTITYIRTSCDTGLLEPGFHNLLQLSGFGPGVGAGSEGDNAPRGRCPLQQAIRICNGDSTLRVPHLGPGVEDELADGSWLQSKGGEVFCDVEAWRIPLH